MLLTSHENLHSCLALTGFVQDFVAVMQEFLSRYRVADLLRGSYLEAAGRAVAPVARRLPIAAGTAAAVAGAVGAPAVPLAVLAGASFWLLTLVRASRRDAAESAQTRQAQDQRRSVRYVFRIPRVENVSQADKAELSEYIWCALEPLNISAALLPTIDY